MLELAFSWLAARPTVARVIAGATRPEQLEQNVRAVSWKLTPAEMAEIDRITAGCSAPVPKPPTSRAVPPRPSRPFPARVPHAALAHPSAVEIGREPCRDRVR